MFLYLTTYIINMGSKVIKPSDIDRYGGISPLTKTGWVVWGIVSLINWLVIAILDGTTEHYFGTQIFFAGLYIAWSTFFYMLGLTVWLILTAFVWKYFGTRRKIGKK